MTVAKTLVWLPIIDSRNIEATSRLS